jgi:nucleoside-triphosphatase THEP1
LEDNYTEQEVLDVADSDDVLVDQIGQMQYMIHQFKDFVGDEENCRLVCELKTTQRPTTSPVYLQIYNQVSGEWETLTSNNTAGINETISLIYEVQDLTDYKDNGVISCRIYQEAIDE